MDCKNEKRNYPKREKKQNDHKGGEFVEDIL